MAESELRNLGVRFSGRYLHVVALEQNQHAARAGEGKGKWEGRKYDMRMKRIHDHGVMKSPSGQSN